MAISYKIHVTKTDPLTDPFNKYMKEVCIFLIGTSSCRLWVQVLVARQPTKKEILKFGTIILTSDNIYYVNKFVYYRTNLYLK
jgi:hypothetical protein